MGVIRGDPVALVVLFFLAAVVSMGGIYALAPAMFSAPSIAQVALVAALGVSLGFSMLVIGRIFWILGRPARKARLRSAK